MKIDIAMSATLRPALLTRALTSLKNNLLFDGSMRLVLDIAEVGDATIKRENEGLREGIQNILSQLQAPRTETTSLRKALNTLLAEEQEDETE